MLEFGSFSSKGMLTGTMVRMLDGSAIKEVTALYYDDRGRVVQSRANNRLNGYDYDLYHYSLTGQVLNHRHVHKTSLIASELIENYRFTYDHADRLISTFHKLNTRAEVKLSELVYDELGRVSQKRLHSGGETIEYTYNIRNWTKSITSNRFSQTLYYQDALDGKPVYYNGNISAVKWGTGATQDKKYHFSYDGLNRMTNAVNSPDNIYDEKVEQYDKNGNILSLKRNGWANVSGSEEHFSGYIDYLTMTYNGNQLVNADDMVEEIFNSSPNDFYNVWDENIETEYLYDDNGNQYADLNKGIAWIKYNLLNLPEKIQFQNGNKIEYLYDASGVKRHAKWAYSSTTVFIPLNGTDQENNSLQGIKTTEYCGNYIYEQGQIKRLLTTEGYITTNNLPMQLMYMWRYNYSLKDYQGNTRQTLYGNMLSGSQNVLYASSSSTIDYYPFGMEMTTPEGNYTSGTNPYLYNGKEIDRMHGLNQYDYGARWRDGALPAWTTVDPLAEKYYSISPYAYCANNPVLFVDPDGRQAIVALRLATKPNKIRKIYRSVKNLFKVHALGATAATGTGVVVYNHFVDGDRSKEVIQALTSPVATAESTTTVHAKSPGLAEQEKRERENKRKLDQNQANISISIEQNFPTPEPNGDLEPKNTNKLPDAAGYTLVVLKIYELINNLFETVTPSPTQTPNPKEPLIIENAEDEKK